MVVSTCGTQLLLVYGKGMGASFMWDAKEKRRRREELPFDRCSCSGFLAMQICRPESACALGAIAVPAGGPGGPRLEAGFVTELTPHQQLLYISCLLEQPY
jgi:hypothetical protein